MIALLEIVVVCRRRLSALSAPRGTWRSARRWQRAGKGAQPAESGREGRADRPRPLDPGGAKTRFKLGGHLGPETVRDMLHHLQVSSITRLGSKGRVA
jgi:hypothetical protein